MKKSRYYYGILLLFILTIISSCTKVIDLKLDSAAGQLVIEGNVSSVGGYQTVKLSQNVPFTNTNTYPPVTGATVSISNQSGFKNILTEGPAGTYSINNLFGVAGDTYTMNVETQGKTYTASSTMPSIVILDSLTSKDSPFDSSKNGKIKKDISAYFDDPVGVDNQYRFVMYVNGVQVKRIFAYDDEFTDGRHVSIDLFEDDIDIYAGDTIRVDMECIDKPMYTYWFTLMQQENNGPGGVAPSNPPTNITPATLGYFSAHTTQSMTVLVK